MNREEAEAGPSRQRRPVTPPRASSQSTHGSHENGVGSSQRPASPETALAGQEERHQHHEREKGSNGASFAHRSDSNSGMDSSGDQRMSPDPSPSAPAPPLPRLDLAKYHTPSLLRLLANLLQQIASANDQIRPDLDEYDDEDGGAGSGGRAESIQPEGAKDENREGRSTSVKASTGTASSSRAGSRTSSVTSSSTAKRPHPSPTSALFPHTSTSHSDSRLPSPGVGGSASDPHPASLYAQPPGALFSASKTSLLHPASLLSFHARHVPSISIEAYLLRILKYCPTTNEVFLSLLVYFDRMSKLGTAQGLGGESVDPTGNGNKGRRGFAIDSYNVHRLVIAGVTVASKFFSDVFYTNSRYAKVGGLPPSELNQLELQFLLLNDFRLAIPIEEMQRYGDRLLVYSESKEQVQPPISSRIPAHDQMGSIVKSEEKAQPPAQESVLPKSAGENARSDGASGTTTRPVAGQTEAEGSRGGTAVVRGAAEAMDVDDDNGDPTPAARANAAAASQQSEGTRSTSTTTDASASTALVTPVVSTATTTQTTTETTSRTHETDGPVPTRAQSQPQPPTQTLATHPTAQPSRTVSFQRPDRSDRVEREASASGSALRWGGAAEGLVSGST